MEKTACFTISKSKKGYDIKCKAFDYCNRYDIAASEIFVAMEQITETLNNSLNVAVIFDVE